MCGAQLAAEGSGELISALLAACPRLSPDGLASRSVLPLPPSSPRVCGSGEGEVTGSGCGAQAGGSGPLHVAAAAANLDALHALLAHRASLTISTPVAPQPPRACSG